MLLLMLLRGRRRRREELLPVGLRPLVLVVELQRMVLLLLLAYILHCAKPLRICVADGSPPHHGRRRGVEEERAGVLCKVKRGES